MLFVIIIAILELLTIIILAYIIRAGSNERFKLTRENSKLYTDMGYRISAHIENTLKQAHAIRHKLINELYTKSLRKNAIVQETSNAFYEQLSNKLK